MDRRNKAKVKKKSHQGNEKIYMNQKLRKSYKTFKFQYSAVFHQK